MIRPLRVRFGRGDAQRNRILQDSALIHSELAAHRPRRTQSTFISLVRPYQHSPDGK
jgi:hypothetical protein